MSKFVTKSLVGIGKFFIAGIVWLSIMRSTETNKKMIKTFLGD